MLNTGVRTDSDVALGLLTDYVDNKSVPLKTSAFMGLAMAYAGSHREEVFSLLITFVADDTVSMEISSLAALALGFVFVGSKHGEISETILQTLMEKFERGDKSLDEKWAKFMVLGLGLLYLGEFCSIIWPIMVSDCFVGLQDASDATVETLKAIDHPISKTAQILVEACSFAGTGNVLKVQSMLHHCDEHVNAPKKDEKDGKDEAKRDDTFQSFAVIAIALISMGEDVGAEMSLRQFNHLVGR